MKYLDKPLFTLEMANNHMGDIEHGLLITREFGKLIPLYPEFNFSMKLQYRDNSFFHPAHIDRKDHRLIKRFTETRLSDENFKRLIDEIHKQGFISMCTPWDEVAVDYQTNMGVQIIKIASCAFTDWRLLEKVASKDLPIVASTAGATEDDILNVNEFFKNRNKEYAILHCVGEYPCVDKNLDLNQIDYLKSHLNVPVGYSTHEEPNNFHSIMIAVGKGAEIFEKHVGVATDKYTLNAYSANVEQVAHWLDAARKAYGMCGGKSSLRKTFSVKEVEDLEILYRGAYAKTDIAEGQVITPELTFLAMPNTKGQLVAKEMGKYKQYKAIKPIKAGEPVFRDAVDIKDTKALVNAHHKNLKALIEKSQVLLPKGTYMEISHHFGLERFPEWGAALIHLINRDYSKIVVVMLAGQKYPEHKHGTKDETYYMLHGNLDVKTETGTQSLTPGQTFSVAKGVLHSFSTSTGAVFEEIATRYFQGDSVYVDESITRNKNRKTLIPL